MILGRASKVGAGSSRSHNNGPKGPLLWQLTSLPLHRMLMLYAVEVNIVHWSAMCMLEKQVWLA